MAVFTQVSEDDARALLRHLALGQLTGLRGIQGGIENTNYFLDTTQGHWVLTLFERLTAEQLPFYLQLMRHLARKGIPVPDPQADTATGAILHTVCGKPAAVVQKLHGASQLAPDAQHCAAVGQMLARMHLAGQDYPLQQPNLRGLPWWNATSRRCCRSWQPTPPSCCRSSWRTRTTSPTVRCTPSCHVARYMPICSATT